MDDNTQEAHFLLYVSLLYVSLHSGIRLASSWAVYSKPVSSPILYSLDRFEYSHLPLSLMVCAKWELELHEELENPV